MSKPKSKRQRHKASQLPRFLAIGGFALLLVAILVFKQKPQSAALPVSADALAEVQLDQALEVGRPVLAFFHSDTCERCITMMNTVAQVFPDYQDSIVLVDVNVYDSQNEPLLRRVRLQYIPTLIFYDRKGQAEMNVGVMEASQLGKMLSALAGEP